MSRKQYIQTLYNQLRKLNEQIDYKIMMGRKYATEARQHRLLVAKIRRHANPGIFDRVSKSIGSIFNYA